MPDNQIEPCPKPKPNSGLMDIVIGKLFSRKLLVFITATYLISIGKLASSDWTMVAALYIGMQGAIDWYKVSKGMDPATTKDP